MLKGWGQGTETMHDLALFALVLTFFHVSEFTLVYLFVPGDLSRDSWLLSKPYAFAMGLALLEYLLESSLLDGFKQSTLGLRALGLVLVVVGEGTRKCAILTAKASFTLSIKSQRRPGHGLVTSGIYSLCRHPGYLGWSIWSVGTQVLLRNPVCFLVFTVWSWKFFAERIPYEESLLLDMFGTEYQKYAERTPIGLPFIKSPIQRT